MATTNDSKTKASNKKDAAKTSTKPTNQKNKSRIAYILTPLALIIAVIASLIAIFGAYKAISNHQHFQTVFQALDKNIHSTAMKNQSFVSAFDNIQSTQNELEDRFKRLDSHTRKTLQEQRFGVNEWQMLKARYYLQLAQINAHWGNNQTETIELLKHADDVLSTTHDPDLFKIRQTIAHEIAQINALPKIDIPGILSELNAVQDIIVDLPYKKPHLSPTEKHLTLTKDKQETWHEKFKNNLNLLEKLVVIRRHDDGLKPMLSEQQESILKQSIGLQFQKAEWAVLHQDQKVYNLTLNRALKEIKQYFDLSRQQVQNIVQQVNQLQEIKLDVPPVHIDESLKQLNHLIEYRASQTSEEKSKGGNA